MSTTQLVLGTVVVGPFWPEPVSVLTLDQRGQVVAIQAVGVETHKFYEQVIPRDQFDNQVEAISGGRHSFDANPKLFRLAVEALRTHLAHAFDPQFAVSVSQVDPLPHQLDAVYRHLLPLPRIRFLLADDPGAGKTIMAGLLLRELMQREDVSRVLVLCPKALTDQWRREMWERFRERFELVTGDMVSSSFGQNVWVENDRIVASVDLAIQEHILPGLEHSSWDMVIFDEAHKLSAYRYGVRGKIDKTKRYRLAEQLAERTKHLLLMTATPHKGDPENFRLLLSLLDDKAFASQAGVESALSQEQSPYFLRRTKEAMKHFDGRPLFLPRHVRTMAYELEEHERQLYDAVTEYVSTGLAKAEQVEQGQRRNVTLALIVLQRRLASSLYAITRSLEGRRGRLTEELKEARAGRARMTSASSIDYDPDDDDFEEISAEDEASLSGASTARTPKELDEEIQQLHELIDLAHSTREKGPEQKLVELERAISEQTVADRNEKILIFTEHTDTLRYLTQQLRERGYSVCNIHGTMKLADRIAAEKEFRGPAQFMVATEAAGEGINLQFCKVMINWDLPWNPNRLEQRMGRIHRYGQEYEVNVINLVARDTREGAVMERLLEKLERMKEALGPDHVYDVISSIVEAGQIRLDQLMREAITERRSLEDILAELDIIENPTALHAVRESMSDALATSFIDTSSLLLEERDSKERRLTPEFVERFFIDGLRHLNGRIAAGPDHDWRIDFVPQAIRREVRAANTGEFGADGRIITFNKERLRREPPAEFSAPGHPLFDAVLGRILEEGRPALATGTVFLDKEAREPYLVWLLEAAVVNGQDEEVHRRLLALRQRGREFEPVTPGVLLDLPPSDNAPAIPEGLKAIANSDAAIFKASELYTADYLAEVTGEQERRANIVRDALQRSVNDNLTALQAQLERQHEDQAAGKDMGIAIRTTNEQIDNLTDGLRERRQSLTRQKVTSLRTPRVVGVAAVIPGPVPKVMEESGAEGGGGDNTTVEMAAMDFAMDYERAQGREPDDVSKTGVGCDVRSTAPDGSVRYIEVKGHAASGDITLYYTEWQLAHRMREEFFIYEVDHALTEPTLRIVQNPVGKGVEAVERVTEYRIKAASLRAVAESASESEWRT